MTRGTGRSSATSIQEDHAHDPLGCAVWSHLLLDPARRGALVLARLGSLCLAFLRARGRDPLGSRLVAPRSPLPLGGAMGGEQRLVSEPPSYPQKTAKRAREGSLFLFTP